MSHKMLNCSFINKYGNNKILRLVLGQLDTNTFILDFGKTCLIVDPADDASTIIKSINMSFPKSKPEIFLTHGHFDHTLAVPILCDSYKDLTVFASEKDIDLFLNPHLNLSKEFCRNTSFSLEKYIKRMKFLNPNDELKFGDNGEKLEVVELAGHTPGSIGLHSRRGSYAIVGDTLMRESIGAVTFPKADDDLMMKNIREKLMRMPKETEIFPGHGEMTTVEHEEKENFFVSGNTMDAEKRVAKMLAALSLAMLEPKDTDYLLHCT